MKVRIESVGFSPDFKECIIYVDLPQERPRLTSVTAYATTGKPVLRASCRVRGNKMPTHGAIRLAVARAVKRYREEVARELSQDAMLHEAGGYAGMEVEVE